MEENEGKNLANDRKNELLERIKKLQQEKRKERNNDNIDVKYYEDCELKIGKNKLAVSVAEITEEMIEQNKKQNEIVTYDIYMKYRGQDVLIACINENGDLCINEEEVKRIDPKNQLGLLELGDNEKPDLSVLKGLDGKTEKELEEEKKQKDKGKNIKDKEESEEELEEDDKEKDVADLEKEKEQEMLARRKGINPKNLCKIRRDSQFYKNYPNIPKTAYFYLDSQSRMHAEYIDKEGVHELPGFTEIKERTPVTRLGTDGQDVREDAPYRVMSAQGLEDRNKETQAVRVGIYKDTYGYLQIETLHQGRNGEWEGKNVDTYGRDRNTAEMNNLIDERVNTPQTGKIAERQEELKKSGFTEDGLTLDEMSKQKKISEYMNEGYTFEEANSIYDYVVGELHLREEEAKAQVQDEIVEKEDKEKRASGGRDAGEEAYDRLINRRGH